MSRTSNRLVIRPPATVSWIALFPNTNESLFALCTVTPAWRNSEHETTIANEKSYEGLRTPEVLGTNLAGQNESATRATF